MIARNALRILVVLALVPFTLAWNPLLLSGGAPVRWDTSSPVVWNPDGGDLGKLGNAAATAMVADEFGKWAAVPFTTISYTQGGQIIDPNTASPTDVTSANYFDVINEPAGENPIIYDNDRDIFDMLGTPSGVLGFAGVLRTSGGTITKGYAVLQGDWFDDEPGGTLPSDPGEISEDAFRGMIVHEFGHFNGLGHSSVNHEVSALDGCPGPTVFQIETMSPFNSSDALTLFHDDRIGISTLYPTAAFDSDFSKIKGRIYARTGTVPLVGANMVLRPDSADCDTLYDDAQAIQSGSNPAEAGGPSNYVFTGLDPSSGYTLLATTINDGGSYLIPPLADLGGPDDYYNGLNEDWFSPPDFPAVSQVITTKPAGGTTGGADVKINNLGSPAEIPGDPAEGLQLTVFDGETALDPKTTTWDDQEVDSASGFLGTAQTAWINRFTPAPIDFPFRLEQINIMFWHPSVSVGRNIQLLVYLDPTGSGNPQNAALAYTEDVTVEVVSSSEFSTYVLATPVLVNSGEFYVGAYDLDNDAEDTFIESLDLDTPSLRSYHQANGTDPAGYPTTGFSDRTFMIRARGSTVPPAGTVRLNWGESCNAGAVPDQDYAVYEGSIASLATVPDHASITCGTGRVREFTVFNPGADRFWLVSPLLANREGSPGTGTGGSSRAPDTTCETVNADPCP